MSDQAVALVVRRAAEKLAKELRSADSRLGIAGTSQDSEYEQIAIAIANCLRQLERTGLVGVDNRLPSSELWNAVGEILCRGWLQNRARTKPRGYAGDYEILAAIYENRRCNDPLGQQFDRYFQEEDAPQAVRNRMYLIRDEIVSAVRMWHGNDAAEPIQISMVGSAFGLEIRDAVASLAPAERAKMRIVLLDLDPAALEFASRTLRPWLEADQVQPVTTNIFRLAARPSLAGPLAGTHLLYCPGLFDYLDDEQAVAILDRFWSCLAPAGKMTVFQFATHNPSRAYMEWLGNWYLIYRDAQAVQQLAGRTSIDKKCIQLGAEPLGVDLWLTARRGALFESPEMVARAFPKVGEL